MKSGFLTENCYTLLMILFISGHVSIYTGSFTLNQELLAGKGLKAMNYLLYNLLKYPYNPKLCCQLFDSFINPLSFYACEILGFSKSKEIERINLFFFEKIYVC